MTVLDISKYLLILLVLVIFLPAFLIQLFRGILSLVIKVQGYSLVSASAVKKEKKASKHVVVTGGSSGIGLELAREYLNKGNSVTIMARDGKKLEEAKADLIQSLSAKVTNVGDKLIAVSCDVSSGIESVSNALKASTTAFGDVDILVNCAGVTYIKDFVSADITEFERLIKINYLGCVYATKAVISSMKENRRGQIVFVSSQVAQASIHGFSAYSPSKWALHGLAEALQMEMRPYNVFVSLSCPPDVDTPMYKEEMKTKPQITKDISDGSAVMSPSAVAKEIISGADRHLFIISHGLEGWLLKQLHPGCTPITNIWEFTQQVFLASPLRMIIGLIVVFWEYLVEVDAAKNESKANVQTGNKSSEERTTAAEVSVTGGKKSGLRSSSKKK
jgi:3-dehydrosphinganine reductase